MATSANSTAINLRENETGHDFESVSIVIPCYNSADSLPELLETLSAVMKKTRRQWEIILINDGSRDLTWKRILDSARIYPELKGINLTRNFGQHNALLAGIRSAQMELIVTIDDDLQHPPAEIPALIEKLTEGYDLVYAIPRSEQHGPLRDFASISMKYILERSLGVKLASDTSAFRIFRCHLGEAFNSCVGPFIDIDAILFWGTHQVGTLTVDHYPRKHGRSNYNFRALVLHTVKMVISYSQVPLRLSALLGALMLLLGTLLLVYVLSGYFIYDNPVPGFTFIAVIIIMFSGTQLFAIGIVGEYIGHLHHRSMGQPAFMVRETVRKSGK